MVWRNKKKKKYLDILLTSAILPQIKVQKIVVFIFFFFFFDIAGKQSLKYYTNYSTSSGFI